MQLTSLGFLFVLLPVGGLIYYFLRGAGRRRFLLGYSLLFVGLLSPLCLLLLLAVMVPDYLLAQYIAMAHPRARSILLGCVIKDISLAVVCSILTELDKLILPVGISIAAFTSVNVTPSMIPSATGYSAASSASCISAPSFRRSSSSPSWMIPK